MKAKQRKKSAPQKPAKKKRPAPKKATRKPAAKRSTKPAKKLAPKRKPAPQKKPTKKPSWPAFVEKHGVVLASARGPVPCIAEAIAGEPIVGSWWSHPKAQVIFDALSSIDDALDIRCFKLVDRKITFVHRRLWPALAKCAEAGVLERDRVESIQQEHMPTGEHRNFTTAYPDWVSEEVAAEAGKLELDDARAQLGAWLEP